MAYITYFLLGAILATIFDIGIRDKDVEACLVRLGWVVLFAFPIFAIAKGLGVENAL